MDSLVNDIGPLYSLYDSAYNMVKSWRNRSRRSGGGSVRGITPRAPLSRAISSARRSRARGYTPRKRRYVRRTTRGRSRYAKRRKGSNVVRPRLTNLYSKKVKRFRKFNGSSRFNMSSLLSNGGVFPDKTFARMSCRASGTVAFDNVPSSRMGRIFCINDIQTHVPHAIDDVTFFTNEWSYLDTFKLFYQRYAILGAKTKIRIERSDNPAIIRLPVNGANPASPNAGTTRNGLGYYYARLSYSRRGSSNSSTDAVGHPLNADGSTNERTLWPTLRDFLSDPTVMAIKDTSQKHVKTGFLWPPKTGSNPINLCPVDTMAGDGMPQIYYELESSNRAFTFNIKFSAKKHFNIKDVTGTNEMWNTFDDPRTSYSFRVFIGYIAFGFSNYPVTETPLDMFFRRRVTVNTTAYVGLQDPLLKPSTAVDLDVEGTSRTIPTKRLVELLEARGEVDTEALTALKYSIDRNSDIKDDAKAALANDELQEEIENLLETESEDEEEEEDEGDLELLAISEQGTEISEE